MSKAFDTLKEALTSDSVLAFPDFNKKFVLATDASGTGIGACLSQEHDGFLKPVAFAGRGLNTAEKNYTVTEQELLGVVYAIQQFRVYLLGQPFDLHTDHAALRWLLDKKDTQGRLARWVTLLQEYQYDIFHVKGKHNVVPDALSRRQYDIIHTPVDSQIDRYPDLGALQVFVSQHHDIVDAVQHPYWPEQTENTGPKLFSVASRANKRRERLRPQLVRTSTQNWREYDFTRENIRKEQARDAHCKLYLDYLQKGTLPDDLADRGQVLKRSEDYIVIDNILYKIFTSTGPKRQDASAQIVIPQNLKAPILKLHHDDQLGGHIGVARMISIMRTKYYWRGMMEDIRTYATTCLSCNASKPGNRSIRPPLIIREPAPAPFHTVIIDTIGPFPKPKDTMFTWWWSQINIHGIA